MPGRFGRNSARFDRPFGTPIRGERQDVFFGPETVHNPSQASLLRGVLNDRRNQIGTQQQRIGEFLAFSNSRNDAGADDRLRRRLKAVHIGGGGDGQTPFEQALAARELRAAADHAFDFEGNVQAQIEREKMQGLATAAQLEQGIGNQLSDLARAEQFKLNTDFDRDFRERQFQFQLDQEEERRRLARQESLRQNGRRFNFAV